MKLHMKYTPGRLRYRLNDNDWRQVQKEQPDAGKDYYPCVWIWADGAKARQVGVSVSRKRRHYDSDDLNGQMWRDMSFSDCDVTCGKSQKKFRAHRCVLSNASPVFKAAFSNGMREANAAAYTVENSTPGAVEAMLEYIYTRKLPAAPVGELPGLLDLAMQYDLPDLQVEAADALVDKLSPATVTKATGALKRYRESPRVQGAWAAFLRKIQMDVCLVESVL